MLFPVWLSHVSRTCTALFKHGVGVEPPFWPDFWDRGRACARGGGYMAYNDQRDKAVILSHICPGDPPPAGRLESHASMASTITCSTEGSQCYTP